MRSFLKKTSVNAEKTEGSVVNKDDSDYGIEAEIGRLDVTTFRVIKGSRTIFNSRTDLFPKIAREEKYHSACFDILALHLASSIPSYRTCAEVLNHLRWQDDENLIKLRTLSDAVEREGNKIIDHIKSIAEEVHN